MPTNIHTPTCSLLFPALSQHLPARIDRRPDDDQNYRNGECRILNHPSVGSPDRRKGADRRVFRAFPTECLSELVEMLCRMKFPEHDAEDAAQEAVFCLLRRLKYGTAGEVGNWDAWLRSAAIGIARRNAKRRPVCNLIAVTLAFVTPFDEVDRIEEHDKHLAAMRDAIDRLPDRLRIVLVYCRINGHTYAEAAREFKVCKGTINRRLSRARALLREYLRQAGIRIPQ